MKHDRRDVLKTTGTVAIALGLAGCTGSSSGSDDNSTDTSDENVSAESPGWFDIDSNVLEERTGQEIEVASSSLFRTPENFGIRFTVANRGGAALTDLTVHVNLLNANDEVYDEVSTTLSEAESIDDLATNETWSGDIVFEGTDPTVFGEDVLAYDIWATAEAEQGAGNGTTGGGANGIGANTTDTSS